MTDQRDSNRDPAPGRYARGTAEFDRVTTLSDGIFAIAMTLLVFGIDVPSVSGSALVDALRENVWQFVAFGVGFGVIARFWWVHHRLVGLLGSFEPGLIALNLVFLGGIALMPFTTALIGATSLTNVAVMIYLGLLGAVTLVFTQLIVRARSTGALRRAMPDDAWPYVVGSWLASAGVTLLAILVAFWLPVAGLVMLALFPLTELLFGWLAPDSYGECV